MKNLNLIILLILGYQLFSCNPKTEKKQPTIYNNYNQNYKFDDDEMQKRNTKKVKNTKQTPKYQTKKKA